MTSDFVFIGVSVILIAAYTGYNIWLVRRKVRLFRTLTRILEENRQASDQPPQE